MRESAGFLMLAGLLAASCSTVNPQIGQLAMFKQEAAARNWQAIADATVSCVPGTQGCAQLHQIKADACLSLERHATPAQQAADGDCAVAEYQAAIAAQLKQPDPVVDTTRLQVAELDALSRRRDRSRSKEEAARFNDALLNSSQAMLKAAPTQASGQYYLGDALLSQALSEQQPASCDTLNQATRALARASQRPGAYADAIAQRQRDIANAAQADGCKL